jgi:hypothetical protein
MRIFDRSFVVFFPLLMLSPMTLIHIVGLTVLMPQKLRSMFWHLLCLLLTKVRDVPTLFALIWLPILLLVCWYLYSSTFFIGVLPILILYSQLLFYLILWFFALAGLPPIYGTEQTADVSFQCGNGPSSMITIVSPLCMFWKCRLIDFGWLVWYGQFINGHFANTSAEWLWSFWNICCTYFDYLLFCDEFLTLLSLLMINFYCCWNVPYSVVLARFLHCSTC